MCSVPAASGRTNPVDSASAATSDSSALVSFFKDGRKISVGDCALFQAGNSPPFIGIIRSLTSGEEDCPKLEVNWLYRPADVKLSKGIFLEAAPNEIFYSFHKDEISAASLLHPCKVAFLRKGVELPSGISSFVCWQVYDIQNRCLWWLTDQDYINEHQEEVDQLLDQTRLEMQAAVQSGARSPKPLNGPTSTQQLKPGSESVQNSTTLFPSQGKGRKRERGDLGQEQPIKRERSSRADDGDSSHYKLESMPKAEIAKITDKGGLVNSEGVDKLVHLIYLDRADKKIDLAGRIMLMDVIAATDKPECLDRFVELRGILVLDEWLQETHKGKAGDGNSPKENDKSVEEFLLVLLGALDKLPVNLHALQTSNVGKSVNNLRSHKNLEIQKKARSLVDIWKKRVDLEMRMNDAKSASSQSVSWPGKAGFSEVPHGGNSRSGSSDVAVKSVVTQPSGSKTGSVKLSHVDTVARSASAPPGSMKLMPSSLMSATTGSKDLHCKVAGGSTSEMPLTSIREEKSSSSSQSQNNSQSCSSDHAKYSCKEDARSSAGSVNPKSPSSASRTRKSSNGLLGSAASVVQKESILGKPGVSSRNKTPEKSSQAGPVSERSIDMSTVEHGNSPRLIVRLPNPGRSPAQSASGGSFEGPSVVVSRASSPGVSDKQDHHDRKAKGKSETCRTTVAAGANMESLKSNDVKNGFSGPDEGDRSAAAICDEEEQIRNTVENVKSMDSSKATCSSSGNEKGALPKSGKPLECSFSINALIESCVKFSEASSSLSVVDDVGMNLLASVATGEMPKSEPASPSLSPEINSPARDDTLTSNSGKLRSLHDDVVAHGHGQLDDNAYSDSEKQGKSVGPSSVYGAAQEMSTSEPGNPFSEHKGGMHHNEEFPSSTVELHQVADLSLKSDGEPGRTATEGGAGSTYSTANGTPSKDLKEELSEGEGRNQPCEKKARSISVEDTDGVTDAKPKVINESLGDNTTVDFRHEKVAESSRATCDMRCVSLSNRCDIEQVTASCIKVEKEAIEKSPSSLMANEKTDVEHEKLSSGLAMIRHLPPVVASHDEILDGSGEVAVAPPAPENAVACNSEKVDCTDVERKLDLSDVERIEQTTSGMNHTNDNTEENTETKEVTEHDPSSSAPHEGSITVPAQVAEEYMKSAGSKLSCVEEDKNHKTEECISAAGTSSLSNHTGSDIAAKVDFDLNEGFAVDEEANPSDLVITTAAECNSAVHLPSRIPHPVSPGYGGLPASITVASAAKGPFVHPENLLRSKGELGWKGSAATSAFRRAEPRKVLEMPLSTTNVTSNHPAAGKRSVPPLDIDLNVPVDRVPEDMASRSSVWESVSGPRAIVNSLDLGTSMTVSSPSAIRGAGGLDLDLNRADESADNGHLSACTSRRIELPPLPVRSSPSCGFSNNEVNILRDFDLNNGPGFDEVGSESALRNQLAKSSGPFPSHVTGLGMNNAELGSISSWFSPGTSYPDAVHPSFLADRGEHPYSFLATTGAQRILGSATGGNFGGDLYRGPVLSSPAMTFSPAVPFPYAGISFGSSFPLASTSFSGGSTAFMDSFSGGPCFPAAPSQLAGPAGAVSSHYPRPYVISLAEGTPSNGDSSRKWGRHGLDLNSGPGSTDVVGRDDRLTSISGQLSVANPQGIAEEQARFYLSTSGPLKRKESEGGWDAVRFSHKQASWQE